LFANGFRLVTLQDLRRQAIATSLFKPTTLRRAVERMGFVQADPIRAPARAQDLILRHRVKDYRVGDLERRYHRLGLEEDRFYAHGFLPRSIWRLLHPRVPKRPLTAFEKRVLDVAQSLERIHPTHLEKHFGRGRTINDWGGQSKATTRALASLHYRGHLRVAGRKKGIRVYAPVPPHSAHPDSAERHRQIVLAVVAALEPISVRSLKKALGQLLIRGADLVTLKSIVTKLIESGELAHATVDEIRYVWRAETVARNTESKSVRFLAPFDPLVWDRDRFERFWGWPYRFEAYVPAPKRKLGYYAMPLLWRDDVIGWVNASKQNGKLTVEAGFTKAKPRESAFREEFHAEMTRLQTFLQERETTTRVRNHRATKEAPSG
jgi:uncharacterized protein YcaQ